MITEIVHWQTMIGGLTLRQAVDEIATQAYVQNVIITEWALPGSSGVFSTEASPSKAIIIISK